MSLWKKSRVPNRVKSFREINSGEDRPRARPGFVKPIINGLRKKQRYSSVKRKQRLPGSSSSAEDLK